MPVAIFNFIILSAVAIHIILFFEPDNRRQRALVVFSAIVPAVFVLAYTPAYARWYTILAFLAAVPPWWVNHIYIKRELRRRLAVALARREQQEQERQEERQRWEETERQTATANDAS